MKTYYLTTKITAFTLIILALGLLSCSKDDGGIDCAVGFCIAGIIVEEAADISEATIAYSNDPSEENCKRYVDALNGYFNALKGYEDCAAQAGQLSEFRVAIAEAQADLESYNCE